MPHYMKYLTRILALAPKIVSVLLFCAVTLGQSPRTVAKAAKSYGYVATICKDGEERSGAGTYIAPTKVVTAGHLVNPRCLTTVSGEKAERVVQSTKYDLAFIFVAKPHVFATMSTAELFQPIFYIGAPLGIAHGVARFGRLIYIRGSIGIGDATTVSGDSGAGVFNDSGKLIGIVTGRVGDEVTYLSLILMSDAIRSSN